MASDVVILSLADRQEWEQIEHAPVMPSQCWRYAAALVLSGLDPRLAVVECGGSRLLLPYVERQWHDAIDITTMPGLSGASVTPASAAPLDRWHEVAASRGWVSGYIQLSAVSYPNVPPETRPVHHTHMFLLNPRDWDAEHSPSLIIRRKIAAALRAGAVVSDDRATLRGDLLRLHPEMLARLGAPPALSAATIDAWACDEGNLLLGASLGDATEVVHLIHVHQNHAELHLVGASPRGRALSALLYTAAIERLKAIGVTCFNLGGGGNPGDGLYMFKSWLGGRPVPLQSLRHIYLPTRYESLCAAANVLDDASWFPAYRAGQLAQGNG